MLPKYKNGNNPVQLYLQNFIQISKNKLAGKPVISIPLRFISMILLRKTLSFSAFGQALDRLVTVSSTRYRASTSALSTL